MVGMHAAFCSGTHSTPLSLCFFENHPNYTLYLGVFFENYPFARCFSGDFPKDYVFIPLFALKNLVCIKLPFIFVSV